MPRAIKQNVRLCCPECDKRVELCCCWEKEALVECEEEESEEDED